MLLVLKPMANTLRKDCYYPNQMAGVLGMKIRLNSAGGGLQLAELGKRSLFSQFCNPSFTLSMLLFLFTYQLVKWMQLL